MPTYSYKAKSLKGKEKSGTMEAKDQIQLSKKLRGQGFMLVKAVSDKEKQGVLNIEIPSLGGVSLAEKMFFSRNLEVMVAAGLPLPKAITSLSEQVKNTKFKKALSEIADNLAKGKSLSESMAGYPKIFSELFVNMIKIGEESGNLEKVLKSLTVQMEKEYSLKSRVQGAMIYPAIIVMAMTLVGALMLTMIVPKLAETFEEMDVELPATTRLVIGIGNFLNRNWLLAIAALVLAAVGAARFFKIESVKKHVDRIALKIPVASSIIKSTNAAYAVRNLSSLTGSGIPLPRSLEITSATLPNFYFRKAFKEAAEKVRKGGKLSEVLENYKDVYPPIVVQMVSVGEETGETSKVLAELADFFEEEVANATKNLTSVIEPVLMIVIGVTIGFFAVSMIQPMYSVIGSI